MSGFGQKLTKNSSTADVLECAINAYCAQSDDENLYDDLEGRYMSVEDAYKVVEQLRDVDA